MLKQGLITFPYRYNLKCFYQYFLTIITKRSCINLKCFSDLSCLDNYTAGTCACYYQSVACECEVAMNERRNVWNYHKLIGKQQQDQSYNIDPLMSRNTKMLKICFNPCSSGISNLTVSSDHLSTRKLLILFCLNLFKEKKI